MHSVDDTRLRRRILETSTVDENGCWLWTGRQTPNGYAVTRGAKGNSLIASRLAYKLFVGPVPDELVCDHLCFVRHCVNPWHLEPVTQSENLQRSDTVNARASRQTHCVNGHPFNEENIYWRKGGKRGCRACWPMWYERQRQKRLDAKKAAA